MTQICLYVTNVLTQHYKCAKNATYKMAQGGQKVKEKIPSVFQEFSEPYTYFSAGLMQQVM